VECPGTCRQRRNSDGRPGPFDYHHHSFTDRGLTYREGSELARKTWEDVRPITHYSEPARLHGEADARLQDHSEHVASVPEWLRRGSDVMIECHRKEQSVLCLREAQQSGACRDTR